ncbi:hypothetical protein NADFUDRAFT_39190 [Nadsonia fulvescens var. elongata DSM 6958]|uniref:Uncharacterized protein n=1 Tax=Nadsonia fulvescens var. elongata DSM 6958 TaxID=857566 RepID=A0A1E3PQQ6_9ASCO|nr:hypothetical protein NADFUDRAFT_39190 [Nadsonia fulvescens var. elongata DSM 6958]
MNSTCFRDLTAHKVPVLRLYRRLLRHSTYLEQALTKPIITKLRLHGTDRADVDLPRYIRREIKNGFRDNKGLMSSYIVNDRLNEAYQWEEILRGLYAYDQHELRANCLAHLESRYNDIEKTKKNKEWEYLLENVPWRKHAVKGKNERKQFDLLNEPPKQGSEGLSLIKQAARTRQIYKKVVDKLKFEKIITQKANLLDERYLQTILVPEIAKKRQNRFYRTILREREEKGMEVKLKYIQGTRSLIPYLKFPWGQSDTTSVYIRKHIIQGQRDFDRLKELEWWKMIAEREAEWEYQISEKNKDLSQLRLEWRRPFDEEEVRIKTRSTKYVENAKENRLRFIDTMRQLNNKLEKKAEKNRIKWRNYDKNLLGDPSQNCLVHENAKYLYRTYDKYEYPEDKFSKE